MPLLLVWSTLIQDFFFFRFEQLIDIHFSLEKLNILLSLAALRLNATLR